VKALRDDDVAYLSKDGSINQKCWKLEIYDEMEAEMEMEM
jgi:hypothetical protein